QVVKARDSRPDFQSELLTFDIVDPDDLVLAGDVGMLVELWEETAWTNDLLASVELSAVRLLKPDGKPTMEYLPMESPSGYIEDRMKVQVRV
ncbi:unnamed protein product, partial [Choristocarpus tenellus]